MNLSYERHVFDIYTQVLIYIEKEMSKVTTLEEDLELLKKKDLAWTLRMAIVYRSEKKKILKS